MIKKNVIFIIIVLCGNSLFSQFYKRDFYNMELFWDKGQTPLIAYKTVLEQPYYFIYLKKTKDFHFEKMSVATISTDTFTKPMPLDTSLKAAKFYQPDEYLYFDTMGRLIKHEFYKIDSNKIVKKITYIENSDTDKVSIEYYLWNLSDFSTTFKEEKYYYRGNERINSFGKLPLYNYMYIDTLRLQNTDIQYFLDKKIIIEIPKNENLNYSYKAKLDMDFNKKNLPKRIEIVNYDETGEKRIIKTVIKYRNDGRIALIKENEYKLDNGSKKRILVNTNTLKIVGNYKKLENINIFLNKKLIYERKVTKNYILEKNYETGEYRYIMCLNDLPVYEITLKKERKKYFYRQRVCRYKRFGAMIDW